LRVSEQDGYAPGAITGETFDEKGVLQIAYSNGQTVDGPSLALARIADTGGLLARGNSLFEYRGGQTVERRRAGDDLTVNRGSLELSNVDLTQQFGELILLQRGYQASSQVISTANDMLQELLQMRSSR
jgi:flagellar hook protein FlgE